MKTYFLLALMGVIALIPTGASAQTDAVAPSPVVPQARLPAQPPMVRIAPAANDAVVVVNNFMMALAAGNLTAARELLDPEVVVISNGSISGSREEYMAKQAQADADAMRKAQRQLVRRDARAGNTFAWVISEKLFRIQSPGKTSTLSISETMLLAKAEAGWKIVHVHWSSRPVAGR